MTEAIWQYIYLRLQNFFEKYDYWIQYVILILLSCVMIPVLYVIMKYSYPDIDSEVRNAYLGLAAGIFSGITTGFFVAQKMIKTTFEKNFSLKFTQKHARLKKEIWCNKKKFDGFNRDVYAVEKFWLDRTKSEKWLPKYPSIRPGSKYLKEYLSTTAYYYFVTSEDFEFEAGRLERICNFYYYCIKFSDESQAIEDRIDIIRQNFSINDKEGSVEYGRLITEKIDELFDLYKHYNKHIQENYDSLNENDRLNENEQIHFRCG